MLQKFTFTLFLLISCVTISQTQSLEGEVIIIEKKTGKRVVLFAENKTKDTLNIFLMVNAKGYRKSASKPILKNILPNSKIAMITLIELSGETSSYTYDLIVNDKENEISISYDKIPKEIDTIIDGKLILFNGLNCEKCTLLLESIKNKSIKYQLIDINENPIFYRQFIILIEKELTLDTKLRLPLIWNKNYVIFGYDDIEIILKELE